VPFWLKPDQPAKQPYGTINARAETIRTASTYREPFKTKRCLVPATGWYDWQGDALCSRWRLRCVEGRRRRGDHQLCHHYTTDAGWGCSRPCYLSLGTSVQTGSSTGSRRP
jgi:hypothetical protein